MTGCRSISTGNGRCCDPRTHDIRHTFLSQPVQFLKGVGPRKAEALTKSGSPPWVTCCSTCPGGISTAHPWSPSRSSIRVWKRVPLLRRAEIRREVTVVGDVRSFRVMGIGRKARLVLVLADRDRFAAMSLVRRRPVLEDPLSCGRHAGRVGTAHRVRQHRADSSTPTWTGWREGEEEERSAGHPRTCTPGD